MFSLVLLVVNGLKCRRWVGYVGRGVMVVLLKVLGRWILVVRVFWVFDIVIFMESDDSVKLLCIWCDGFGCRFLCVVWVYGGVCVCRKWFVMLWCWFSLWEVLV